MGDAVAAGDASLGPEVQAPAESPDAATEAEGGLGEDASEGAADAQGADTAGDAAGADPQQGCTYTPDPGAVTIQRLNRAEYDNTVLDLLLDASAPARDFPPDDHGYGFDHISDVLTVSPLLFEKHERAVGRLVETLLTREVKGTTVFEAEAEDLGGSVGAVAGLFWNLWANGTVTAEFEVAEGGIWLASARVSGQQAGPELVALELRVDDVALGAHHTASANGSIATYAAAVQLSPGPHTVQVAFLNDYWIEGVEDRNLLVDSLRIEGPFQPGAVSLHVEADSPPSADGMAVLASDAALEVQLDVPAAGTFQVWMRAASLDEAAGAPVEVTVAGEVVGVLAVGTLGLAPSEASLVAALGAGSHTVGFRPLAGPVSVDFVRLFGPLEIEQPPPPAAFASVVTCEPSAGGSACLEEIVTAFARRAWRRPAAPAEVTDLLALAQLAIDQDDGELVGLELALKAVLLSPHFIFRPQVDPELDAPAPRPLTSHELASRLSYALWSRPPDAELSALADAGALQEDAVLEQQIRRLIDDARSVALIDNFAGQWLHLRALDDVFRDAEAFPAFDEDLAGAMRTETELVFDELLHGDADFLDLLDADFTWVNGPLGALYGLPTPAGADFERVSTVGTQRRGLLTHGSLLTVTSHTFRTSPVKRGKWVLGQLMCQEPPPPPPGVDALIEQQADTGEPQSIRDLMAQHISDPSCATCHKMMDPIGFALENFDAIGAWRVEDNGFPVDATGTLPDGTSFDGALELAAVLKQDPATARCIVRQLFTYLVGRDEREGDRCEVDELAANWSAAGRPLRELIVGLLMSDAFRLRTPSASPVPDEEVTP